MDPAAQRARDRESFREFLDKHRYAPQLIQRNVKVARHAIDSCKQEREQAKAKHESLMKRKNYLEESLRKARQKEQALLASVRRVEHEQDELVRVASDKKQRELLRRAFTAKNDDTMAELSAMVDQVLELAATTARDDGYSSNQIEILLAEYKRMLKSANNTHSLDFGDSDINHLRESSGTNLVSWAMEIASRPHTDAPDDEDDAKYAAHVEENSSSSHEALVQIQSLLRQSQAEHIASFVKAQKAYAKASELKHGVDQATGPDASQTDLWGNESGASVAANDNSLVTETVDLQIQSHVNAVALNYATRTLDAVAKQVDAHRQQKQDLENKVALMNQFDERQRDIVAQIRSKYRQNQELLQSLTRKQSRLLQVLNDETRLDVKNGMETHLTAMRKLVMDELRAFSSVRLGRLDAATKKLSIASQGAAIEDARAVEVAVPFEEFYINQVRSVDFANGQQQVRNGYRRLGHALGAPEYGSWASILAQLHKKKENTALSAHGISDAIRLLEQDVTEDRTRTIPEAQAVLTAMQRLTESMTSVSLSRLEEVAHVNKETLEYSIPELSQVIDDWFTQPAWSAQLQTEPTTTAASAHPATTPMDVTDLLR